MRITELPTSLTADAVALWGECGLTRPWNDPDEDARRALRGPDSTVLACLRAAGAASPPTGWTARTRAVVCWRDGGATAVRTAEHP